MLTAPMVESATSVGDVTREQKFFVNYWFRHVWEYVWPLYPGIVFAAALVDRPVRDLSILNLPLRAAALDVDGVGLLRAELMVIEALEGSHPRTLIEKGMGDDFASRMASALETFAGGFAPRPVTYRTIDFRTNEFRGLEGGERFGQRAWQELQATGGGFFRREMAHVVFDRCWRLDLVLDAVQAGGHHSRQEDEGVAGAIA